jgi:hypothetical protein
VTEEVTAGGRTSGILDWLPAPPSILQKMHTHIQEVRTQGATDTTHHASH